MLLSERVKGVLMALEQVEELPESMINLDHTLFSFVDNQKCEKCKKLSSGCEKLINAIENIFNSVTYGDMGPLKDSPYILLHNLDPVLMNARKVIWHTKEELEKK